MLGSTILENCGQKRDKPMQMCWIEREQGKSVLLVKAELINKKYPGGLESAHPAQQKKLHRASRARSGEGRGARNVWIIVVGGAKSPEVKRQKGSLAQRAVAIETRLTRSDSSWGSAKRGGGRATRSATVERIDVRI